MTKFLFRLVTFDINGILLKPTSIGKTYAEFGKRHGITACSDRLETEFSKSYKIMNRIHPNFGLFTVGWKNWWTEIVKVTFQNSLLPTDYDRTKLCKIADDLIQFFTTGESWTCVDGSLDVLQRLKSNKIDIGIITNTDPRLHAILREKNLNDFIFVLTSYEARIPKPHTGIFTCAENMCSAVTGNPIEGKHILHVGNSLELDFLAAKRAGWNSVLVSQDTELETRQLGEELIGNMAEFERYLVNNGCR